MGISGDSFIEMRSKQGISLEDLENLFNCTEMDRPIMNIICRTHDRETEFQQCYKSIKKQTYPNYSLLVGSDVQPCTYYPFAIPLKLSQDLPTIIPEGHYFAPWNIHLETLAKSCVNGYTMYLDDDDEFTSPDSLETIMNNVEEDKLLIWRVQITPEFIVPRSQDFGQIICAGNISGIGIAFHTKHLPVQWGNMSYGDYRIIRELIRDKGLTPKFINKILTSTQNGPRNGR